ncbi:putative cleavage and polyadenylation specificity factor subunit 2 protein [Lasiodiplodia theobromae]|uniref:Cleavage and polyadenylation specificity factor subunit 2 n=1 Tax=Lasiodiplodia theobromae TaxID=45133 RepID=A0A5N5D297_9PEZI|nr:Cleavage and polyadenylation specificity factor subunit 2 protein [Lasiodiplodia theobromae]KAB2571522.1 Cleavage factor two protein 2 [Lasiodiplodia theobromae]KAF4536110.1 Cleavage and polyadenylation specificity factor subunit 2 protein [Lasiodiplodia theobromae]KAF9634356.1 putative cleavage and polyadenylation specificity factor subunit 2 protein [Lasiodiplodia theobromae]
MFNFTPLLGAQSTSAASQSLLELDGGIKILVDVGWDEGFNAEKLKELERQIPTLSVILLTHATAAHLGAFAHCCKHFPLFTRIPVYATTPVISLGRTLLQDLYSSTPLASSIIPEAALSDSAYSFPALQGGNHPNILLQPPTSEEIAHYFSLINPLKYSQPHQPLPSPFSPPLNGLTITAYSAGHTLGGTIWHIQHGMESVVYAVDWNQAREHVLSGAAWLGGSGAGGAEVIEQLRRPTAMICSSRGAERIALAGGRQKRDELLLNMIKETVSNGGSVLIPSDSSARILELAYLLESTWSTEPHSLGNTPLFLASRTCGATMRYARSMLEWMDEGIVREFEVASSGQGGEDVKRTRSQQGSGRSKDGKDDAKKPNAPFDFKNVKLVERKTQVNRMLSTEGPKVILASDVSLEWGFSKEALRNLAADVRNLVVLTERVAQPSDSKKGLGRLLWELWAERSGATKSAEADESAAVQQAGGAEATVEVAQATPLEGNEVPLYQHYLAQQRQLHNTLQTDGATSLETAADVIDDRSSTSSESSEESDTEHQGKSLNISAAMTHARQKLGLSDAELGINILLRRKNVHDYDTRGKKGREKMFPYVAKRRRGDEFGDLIRPEEYLRAEERDEVDGQDMRNGTQQKDSGVGQKRKWDEQTGKPGAGKRQATNGTTKRRRQQEGSVQGSVTNDDQAENDDSGESEDEAPEEEVAGPSKIIFTQETVRLQCRIAFVDFSGLHDKRSLQLLIPMIRPRKLILVAGEQEETLALAADCRKLIEAASAGSTESAIDVFTPTVGITVDASVDTNAWTVKLSQNIVRRLRWQNVKGLGVVAITGRLEAHLPDEDDSATENGGVKKKVKGAKGGAQEAADKNGSNGEVNVTPVLDIVPASMAAATRSVAQPLHVGDLRLADLRKIMQSSGFAAEFRGEGTLLINGSVVVRKSGTGRIEVESSGFGLMGPGRPDGTFYAVKRKIYEGLAVVAGG